MGVQRLDLLQMYQIQMDGLTCNLVKEYRMIDK